MVTTPLRQRMLQALSIRNLSPRTTRTYISLVSRFALFFHRSPDRLGLPQIERYLFFLRDEKKVSYCLFNQTVCALRFFYLHVMDRPDLVLRIPNGRREKHYPIVLSAGEVLAKVMKTVVIIGEAFGGTKLVDLGGHPHTVLMFGNECVMPIIDIFNQCADAGLKSYAEYTIDPRPYDFNNLETTPEHQYKIQKLYNRQSEMELVHLRLGAKNYNYWSCACYWPEVGNAPKHGTNLA